MDGMFLLSTEKKVLDQPFLRIEDIRIGEVIKGIIERVLDRGAIIVKVADGISGLVNDTHLSDIKLKNPEKKFRQGVEVKCKVYQFAPHCLDFQKISQGESGPFHRPRKAKIAVDAQENSG